MNFFLHGVGQYIVQSMLHCFVIAIIVEAIMKRSGYRSPFLQIKFRSLSLALPVIYLSAMFLLVPYRNSVDFRRQEAIFDTTQWLSLRPEGAVLTWVAVAIIAATVFLFLTRELVPFITYRLRRRPPLPPLDKGLFPEMDSLLERLASKNGRRMPAILLSEEGVPSIHTLGRKAIVISKPALQILDGDELEAVMAHEFAHFSRTTVFAGKASSVLRVLMFWNPVALLVYHRINNDIEKHCDDQAIANTGKPMALVTGLLKIARHTIREPRSGRAGFVKALFFNADTLDKNAHLVLVKERAERILKREPEGTLPYQNTRVIVTALLLMALLFFVV